MPPNSNQDHLPKSFSVQNISIPAIGFGTFQSDGNNTRVKDLVLNALKLGYRHIDTAAAYGNERQVGEAIKESGISREELFVTTKLAQTWHAPEDVDGALEESLRELQLEYVDLYLMHFPYAYVSGPNHTTVRHENNKPVIDYQLSREYPSTWTAMEKLVDSGKTRLIGVSNFNILKLRRILAVARIPPAVNQVELHPYLPQVALLKFCTEHNIHVTAHQPLGGSPVAAVNPNASHPGPLVHPSILSLSHQTGISSAQILLTWALQRQTSVIPKTVQISRMQENIALSSPLSEKVREMIDRLVIGAAKVEGGGSEEGEGDEESVVTRASIRFLDPSGHVGFDVFDEEADQPV